MTSSFTSFLSPSTWRTLGYCVGATYIGLGSFGAVAPLKAADSLGILPTGKSAASTSLTSNEKGQGKAPSSYPGMDRAMFLLGSRDVCIGLAIILCGKYDMPNQAMGLAILASLPLCVVDVVSVHLEKGWQTASGVAIIAASWMGVGVGLLG